MTKDSPKVSIIIPHWNGIEILSECIDSLQKTTFHIIDTDRKLIIPNTSLYGLKCEKVLPQNGGPKKNLGLEAWKKDLEGMMIKKEKCCHPKSKSGYKKGDLYKTPEGKRILKG